jgi:UDP-N-acetyl-D-glucosamine dehydrogenase
MRAIRPPSESPSSCCAWEQRSGRPTPLVTEPTAIPPAVARADATPEEIAAADAVALLTDHDAFTAADVGRHARCTVDCRRVLSGPNVETL